MQENTQEKSQNFISNTRVFDTYGKGWRLLFSHFWVFVGMIVLLAILEMVGGGITEFVDEQNSYELFSATDGLSLLVGILLTGPVRMSLQWVMLRAARKEKVQFDGMFAVFSRNYWQAVLAGIISMICIVIGLALFIIPGIIIAVKLTFVPFLIMDKKMTAFQSIKASWKMTNGYGMRIFGMLCLSIFILIAGVLALLVGLIPATAWISSSFAVLYHSVTHNQEIDSSVQTIKK